MAYTKKDPQQVVAEMDAAAIEAQSDFSDIVDHEALEKSKIVEWWEKWYRKVGHKRLGRILVKGI